MSRRDSKRNAMTLLKEDHATVKDLFERSEESESPAEMRRIMDEAIQELKVHATVEEELFYPAIREDVGDDLMDEAREEHHVARVLIAELDALKGDDDRRNAKFKVLAEAVKHHIKEEEGEIFPRAERLDMDFDALGDQMMQRKDELHTDGVPLDAEHQMVSGSHNGARIDAMSSPSVQKTDVPREKTAMAESRTSRVKNARDKAKK